MSRAPAPPPPAALLLLAAVTASASASACSGKPRPEGTGSSGPAGSGSAADGSAAAGSAAAGSAAAGSASAGSAGSGSASTRPGDVQIRVEWAEVPAAARASPGRTPCNTPRAASVSPTPTWGVPEAIVLVEGARADAAEARIVLADCALSPRVAVGASLVVESAADRPASIALSRRADLSKPEAAASSGSGSAGSPGSPVAPRILRLPIAGHAVAVSLDPGALYQLATTDNDPETTWLAAPPPGAAVAVTDAAGQALLHGIAAGPHAVTAWLPPRAGQPARLARGTLTVVAGQLAELTLPLAPAP